MQETAAVASKDDADQLAPSPAADDEDETVAKSLPEAASQFATSALKSDAPLHVLGGQVSPLHLRRNSVLDVPTVVDSCGYAHAQKHARLSSARCVRAHAWRGYSTSLTLAN